MKNVFLIEPIRTPVGRYGGILSGSRPDDLAAHLIKALIERTSIPPAAIDDIILGCANQAGEDNRNIARMSLLLAGLPETVPGVTVNRLCASSLEAIIQGARAIMSGEADIIIAGGVESMSRAPYVMPKNVSGKALFGNITAFDTALGWRFPNEVMKTMFPLESMGETAENLAEKYHISREDQDNFALLSHQKALLAQQAGVFDEEIIPVPVGKNNDGSILFATTDEQPRPDISFDGLAKLKPAFRKEGSVTAGNSSSLNDGAAVILMAGEKAVQRYGLKPLGRYLSSGAAGVNPRFMGIGPVFALPKALERAGLNLKDLHQVELNEAFAAQALACLHELSLPSEKVNRYGGAIALGHPLGMSGTRIAGSLLRSMRRDGLRYGAATLCIGVGQGLAAIFESV